MSGPPESRPGVVLPMRSPRTTAPARDDANDWTSRRWVVTITAIFVVQAALVGLLGLRPRPPVVSQTSAAQVTLLGEGNPAAPPTATAPALADPADFALVGPQSFSGGVWFHPPPVEHRSNEWSEPARLLKNGAEAARNPAPAFALPRSYFGLGEPPDPAMRATTASALVRTNSTVRVEGFPVERTPRMDGALPAWEHPDVLQPSLVQVTVDELGAVLSATLLASSGLEAADQRALDLARGTVFPPMPDAVGAQIQWGRLIFDWQTLAPGGAAPK